ncbi:type III secretion system stator protein SctL [Salinicola avicenniae]|uniref:type III secretion system stator protein SctL n=1 Tax=Salinicola avicenniae TaxID=2916836 RepID=UPI002073E35B|nr:MULTISPECIES: type III secretion system stator protein SctL [unclassified Salinicola]
MLTRRTLHARPDDRPCLKQALIPRETFEDCGRAEAIVARAESQALSIEESAYADRDALLTRCEGEFWRQATELLEAWSHEREVMWHSIELHASELVKQALARVFEETPSMARLESMLGELSRARSPEIEARLSCHPAKLPEVQEALAMSADDGSPWPWKVNGDPQLEEETLCLETDTGHFSISWQAVCQSLINAVESAEHEARPVEP